ncbi:MAG: radical SAM protein [Oscillospiraceae bacterium]
MVLDNKLLEMCNLCPRNCGVNRYTSKGYCGESAAVRIARAELHFWEEPCISGENGSGTVFFSGCNLKCCFCQNHEISAEGKGFELTVQQLADTFLMLQKKGANNINLVTPTHFAVQIVQALDLCKNDLKIPVAYNCGGYEKAELIDALSGYVDIFLPDLKYYDSKASKEYSNAEDYFEVSFNALKAMVKVCGKPVFDSSGILKSGVIVRHLVLPNMRHDSINLMNILGENFKNDEILISLMSQYTPVYKAENFPELNRRTSTFEYNSVCDFVNKYGFNGYYQQRDSAQIDFIPRFYKNLYYELP